MCGGQKKTTTYTSLQTCFVVAHSSGDFKIDFILPCLFSNSERKSEEKVKEILRKRQTRNRLHSCRNGKVQPANVKKKAGKQGHVVTLPVHVSRKRGAKSIYY